MGPSLIQVPIPSSSIHKIDHMGFAPIPLPPTLAFDSRDRVEGHDGIAAGIELSISDADVAKLMSIAQSRVERARILLGYREDPSFFAVTRAPEFWDHQTVQRCVKQHNGLPVNYPIVRLGRTSARFRRSRVEFPPCRILFADTIRPIQYVPHGRHDAPHA